MLPENISEESKEAFLDSSFETDVAIIGAGVAGMYAAYCCSMADIDYMLIDELATPGGQCTALYPEKLVYGVPGYVHITAKDYISKLSEQCLGNTMNEFFGYKVNAIDKIQDGDFKVKAQNVSACSESPRNLEIRSKYVILATGIGEMKPNIPANIGGIQRISKDSDFIQFYCLNHSLYRDKNVIIAGGGDSAADFAVDIAAIAKHVTIIHRRANFSCEPAKVKQLEALAKSGKIDLRMAQNIQEIAEKNSTRSVYALDNEQKKREYKTDHIVFCYGFTACLGTLATGLGLETEKNLIKINLENMETSIKNCYAVGDVATYVNKKKNIVPCFFEADRAVRAIKTKITGG